MQFVSQAWKNAQSMPFIPYEAFVEIVLNVGDPEAQADASASDNGSIVISDSSQIVSAVLPSPKRYALLENNIWLLDGSFEVIPDAEPYGENGYAGNAISKDDSSYDVNPKITISFSKTFAKLIPGMTIEWGSAYENEVASSFQINVYNGSALADSKTVIGNTSLVSVINFDISNYDRIEVTVLKWSRPSRRARIRRILVGIEKTYGKTELQNFMHEMTVDPLSASLPKAEVSFDVFNIDGEYNPDNPQGAEKYLMERQEVSVRYGYQIGDEIEWIPAGTFYMSEWDAPQNGITARFKARDLLEFMTDTYSGRMSGTLMEIAQDALEQANLPLSESGTKRWIINSNLSNISVPEGLDLSSYKISEVLQLVSHAACMIFYQDRNGYLHIDVLQDGVSDYDINRDVSYANAEISLTKQLKAVDLNDGAYILEVGEIGETQKVQNPLILPSRYEVVASWISNILMNRKILNGQYRADPRLDAMDRIAVENRFSENNVLITSVKYSYNGAFRGTYEGRSNA